MDKKKNAMLNIILYLAIFVFANLFFQLIVTLIVANSYGFSFSELLSQMTAKEPTAEFIKPINLAMAIITFLTYLSLFIALFIVGFKELKKEAKGFKLIHIVWIIGGFLVLYGGSYLISYLTSLAGVGESENQESIKNMVMLGSPYLIFFSVVIFAPFAEELIFRKAIGDLTLPKSKLLFYIVSTLVFALPHMLSTKAEPLDFILMSIPYIYSGLSLAFAYERTRNIYVSMAIHLLNNMVAYIMLFN